MNRSPDHVRRNARTLGRCVFGDRVGLALWLGLLVTLALGWRVGFFIQADEYGVANTLVALANGHLAIHELHYSFSLQTQTGLVVAGDELYGRNYGQVALAVPLVWGLRVATQLAPLGLVLGGAWALATVAFGRQVATVTGRDRYRVVASAAALVGFGTTAAFGAPLSPDLLELAALQASTLAVGAFAGTVFYRLLSLFHARSVSVAGGVAVGLTVPVGFWAAIPKRHVLVATLLLVAVYCFARSRTDDGRSELLATAGAYGALGLLAWVHAFEGFFAMVTLGLVDVATGGLRTRRRIGAVAVGALVGLAPMFVTNALISGNPLRPPRMLPPHGTGTFELSPLGEVTAGGDGSGEATTGNAAHVERITGGGTGGSGGGGDGGSLLAPLEPLLGPFGGVVGQATVVFTYAFAVVVDGIGVAGDPGRMWHILVRSGYVPGVWYAGNGYEVVELSLLESAPLLSGLVALPFVLWSQVRERGLPTLGSIRAGLDTPRRQVDLLVAALGLTFVVVYLPRLPLFSQITLRYVLPAFPLALYGVVRLPQVRAAITGRPRRLATSYGVTVVATVLASALALTWLGVAKGEAVQFHALVNLAAATGFVGLLSGRALVPDRVPVGAVAVWAGVTAGVTTAFYVLARVEYFEHGPHALGISAWIADLLPVF